MSQPRFGVTRGRLAKLAIVACVVIAALSLRWGAGAALLIGLLVASVSSLIDGRVSVVVGLLCLACCPLLLIAEQDAWLQQSPLVNYYVASAGIYTLKDAADQVAIWAYYFLSIGVAAYIARYVGRKRRDSGQGVAR